MKKIAALIFMLATLYTTAVFAAGDITVTVDGEELALEAAAQITNGRTMLPVRDVFEALGADVYWNDSTKTASGVKDGTIVNLTVGSNILKINGERLVMDTEPVITEGRIYVPARYAAEAFGCTARWDSGTKTVSITTPATESETEVSTGTPSCTPDMTELKYLNFNVQPVDYSAMDGESAEIYEEVRSSFEHSYFYDMLAAESKEVLEQYTDMYDKLGSYVLNAWNNNLNDCIAAYVLENREKGTQIGSFEGDTASEDFVSYVTNDCRLSYDVNFNSTPQYFDDCTAFYTELAEAEYISSCRYIVVLFDWDCNFRYYALEKASGGYWNVCETTEDGRRLIASFSADAGTSALRNAFVGAVSADYYGDSSKN